MFQSFFNARPWNTILFPPPVGATITTSRPQSISPMAIPCPCHNSSCRLLNRFPIALEASFIYLALLIRSKRAANSLRPSYLLMAKQVIVSQGARTKLTSMRAITDPPSFIGTAVAALHFLASWLNTCCLWTMRTVTESAQLQTIVESIARNPSGWPGVLCVISVFACFCSDHLWSPLVGIHQCWWNPDCSSDPVGIHNVFHNSLPWYIMTMARRLTI